MALVFGFDIGTTSIGFAVVRQDHEGGTGTTRRLGVRIFPEARDPDGVPLNQTRRQKRMTRRQLRRRRARRKALNRALHEAGFLPAFGSAAWAALMGATDGTANDPYRLRARGLTEALSAHQLGRALYHLAQRRHFRGRDLEDDADGRDEAATSKRDAAPSSADAQEDVEEKKQRSERESTVAALKRENMTLGVWLARRAPGGDGGATRDEGQDKVPRERRRGVHAHRTNVQDEFEKLWDKQAKFHPALCDAEFKARIFDTIFAQRPVFWRKNTLGTCRWIPDEPVCPKSAWISQQRRMLEKLNNLAIEGGNARLLDDDERAAILSRLQTQASMSWAGVRSALKPLFKARGEPGGEKKLKFNLERGGERALLGNAVEAKLASIFGSAWEDHPHKSELRETVPQRLRAADYENVGTQRVVIRSSDERARSRAAAAREFVDAFGVTEEQAEALKDMNLPTGWEPYSARALRAFMPHLEAGVRLGALLNGPEWGNWRDETFPTRDMPTGEVFDKLPSPAHAEEQARISKIRNPTVVRTQNELRKVVNNLIELYGKPDLIRVEVARDLGRSKRDRDAANDANRRRERERKKAMADLCANGVANPTHADVEKWLLWTECGKRCPYTGEQIGFDALFREGLFEVEHIWPRWQSLDDSFRNKTLCHRDVNREKTNRTPYEAFGHDEARWAAIAARVDGMTASKGGVGMAPGKVRRFLAKSMPDDFTSRQLNDTGYAARQAVAFLKRLWPDVGAKAPVNVQAVTGRVTAQLRRLWGLNNILAEDGEKARADHRHHAIDALVVACVHPGMTNKLSRYWQRRDDPAAPKPDLPPPWADIRAQAEAAVATIVVSHRVRKKISGPLHQEMPLGNGHKEIEKNGVRLSVYVKRVPVENLSLATLRIDDVSKISREARFVVRDRRVREILMAHLKASAAPPDKPQKAYPPYPRLGPNGPEIRKARALTTQQKKLMVPVANGFADPANNHHIAVYRLPDGKADYEVVSLYAAARRLSRGEPVVRRDRGDGAAFVMSLSAGEAVEFPSGEKKGIWIVKSIASKGQLELLDHRDANKSNTWAPRASTFLKFCSRKVSLDPLGRVRPAND